MLADSFGVASANTETYHALTKLHHGPGDVRQEDMADLYGEPKPVQVDRSASTIGKDKVRECIAAPPPSPPHIGTDGGWSTWWCWHGMMPSRQC